MRRITSGWPLAVAAGLLIALIVLPPSSWTLAGARSPGCSQATPVASPVAGGAPPASPAVTPVPTRARVVSVTESVTIRLTDTGFDPSHVQSTNGHDLTIMLVNTGQCSHGFQIDALDIDEQLDPGETREVVIRTPSLGDYPYTSDVPGDESMGGTLTFYI